MLRSANLLKRCLFASAIVSCVTAAPIHAQNIADRVLADEARGNAYSIKIMKEQLAKLGLACGTISAFVGGPSAGNGGQAALTAARCENKDGSSVLYEWVRPSPFTGKVMFRIATPEQVSNDFSTMARGFGLAGTWWVDHSCPAGWHHTANGGCTAQNDSPRNIAKVAVTVGTQPTPKMWNRFWGKPLAHGGLGAGYEMILQT